MSLGELGQDFKYAWRGFRRSPGFALTLVLTLTLGIGATTAVFSVVDRILFRALPYAEPERLVSLGMVQSLETEEFTVGAFFYDWRENQKPFEAVTSEQAITRACDVTERSGAQNPVVLRCPRVEGNFLSVMGIAPLLGRGFTADEARAGGAQVALISYGLWRNRYAGDLSILNKTIEIDGGPVRVIGVLPQGFEMPRLQQADVMMPLQVDEAVDRKRSPGMPRRVFARMKPGITVAQATAAMEPLFEQSLEVVPAEIRKDFHLKVRSLRDRQMDEIRPVAWLLFGAVVAVLLIACANVASLLLARGAARARELAVRSALGASRARLAGQALVESMLLALAGAVCGCLLAEALLRVFVAMAPAGIPYLDRAGLDVRIIGITVVGSAVCGLLFGLAPALQRPDAEMLVGRVGSGVKRVGLRQGLVVGQIAVSLVLLSGAMLLLRSFWNLENQQLGMRVAGTLTASVTLGDRQYGTPEQKMAFFEGLERRLKFGPGVSDVAVADSLPPGGDHNGQRYDQIAVWGRKWTPGATGKTASYRWVSPDYFRALDIPIVRGEGFRDDELNSSERYTVLSQALADELFPGQDPIGQRLQFDGLDTTRPWTTVIGVAANVKNEGLEGKARPEYYKLRRHQAEDWDGRGEWGKTAVVVMRTSLPAETMAPWIRGQVAAMDAALPVDVATMRERVSKLADQPRFQTMLVGFFAVTGLVLAVIGLYGVMAFLVAQRTQEIGVRMALGSSREGILRLVLGRSLRLILSGVVAGLVLAIAVSRVMASLLFGIGVRDPWSYLAVTVLLIGVAVMATLIPARAAARVDPMVALRRE